MRRLRSTQRRLQRPWSSQKPPKTPPKLPKAFPRRPRSTPRHSRGTPEVPKSLPVTSQKPLRGSSRGNCAPTRRRNNKRYLLRSHWGTRPQRNSKTLADKITNEACFKATGERSHKAHVLAATEVASVRCFLASCRRCFFASFRRCFCSACLGLSLPVACAATCKRRSCEATGGQIHKLI